MRRAGGGASVVLVAATLAAWLTVEVVAHWLAMERAQERQAKLQQTADALAYQAMGAGMLGAVSLMGLSEPLLKDMARGTVPPDHPAALARLTVARERFLVNGAYVIARDGTVVAHETAGPRSTGVNLAYRPYFQQAMQGGASACTRPLAAIRTNAGFTTQGPCMTPIRPRAPSLAW